MESGPMRHHLCCIALAAALAAPLATAKPLLLAFGSCLRQEDPQPVWRTLLALAPDALVLGGDNVYSDVGRYLLMPEPTRIGKAYASLAANADWSAVRARIPVHATWDDHDFGRNDGGADYPYKEESKAYFMDFFRIPADSPMRTRQGVYDARWIDHEGRRVQLLLLDTRSFRSPLVAAAPDATCPRVRWGQNLSPHATVLGEAQWAWLGERLAGKADLHIVVSGIQVIPDQHCYEKWGNFPHERERLLRLLHGASAPALILSGDRHLGEISRLDSGSGEAPLVELTSSGLNSARKAGGVEANRYRAGDTNVRTDNVATIAIDWQEGLPEVDLALRASADGSVLQRLTVRYPARP